MTYTPNVPQAAQTIAFTQPLIESNFGYIDVAMKVNHTWNGNSISTEAAGSHQRIDMPNQVSDITSLPTGINTVMYSKAGNIFSWNGAKCPVSGVVISGTVNVTPVAATIATLPNDCHGFVTIWTGNLLDNLAASYSFFMTGGVGYYQQSVQPVGSQITIVISISGNNLQLRRDSGINIPNAPFKVIYWPV